MEQENPVMKRSSPFFWNRIAGKYARNPVEDVPSYERKLAETRAYFEDDWHVLEVGCGTGSTAIVHAPQVARYVAVDFSRSMIEIARAKAAALPHDAPRPDFEVAALEDLPVPRRPFDAVLAMSILHLLPDLDQGLRQIRAQMRLGGYVFASTACIGDLGGFLPKILPYIGRTGFLPNVLPLTQQALLDGFANAGFEVVDHWRPRPDAAVFVVGKAVQI